MDNKMYTCAICGKSYTDLSERIACETKCLAERKKAEDEKKRNETKAKQNKSEKEIYEILDKAENMIKEHLNTYNSITLNDDYPCLRFMFRKSNWIF